MAEKNLNRILAGLNESTVQFGLERISKVLHFFENPQNKLNVIHVAGTNAKGSVAKLIYELLKVSGFKTGLYTSPHIRRVNERFILNNKEISNKELLKYIQKILSACGKLKVKLTYFEVLTTACFLYFLDKKSDYVVLETGLGGRLDATNTVKKPLLSVITTISKDHTNYLGRSIKSIALEKAAIIKKGSRAVIGHLPKNAHSVMLRRSKKMKTTLFVMGREFSIKKTVINPAKKTVSFQYSRVNGNVCNIMLKTISLAQGRNTALALAAFEIITGKPLNSKHLTCIRDFNYQGRIERLMLKRGGMLLEAVFDGGHNPEAVKNLSESLNAFFPNRKKLFVFNFMADKDYRKCIKIISENADRMFVKKIRCSRALKNDFLLRYIKNQNIGKPVFKFDTIDNTFLNNVKKDELIVFCGSFYLISETERELINGGVKILRC